jgi:hypothetical protein
MSLPTTLWGRSYWKFLHFTALIYPIYPRDTDKARIRYLIENLHHFLPCSQCSRHMLENIKFHPLTDDTLNVKLKLLLWVHDLHNMVNKTLGKEMIQFEDSFVRLLTLDEKIECCSHDQKINNDDNIQDSHIDVTFDDVCHKYNLKRLFKKDNNVIELEDIYKTHLDFMKKHEEISKIAIEKEEEFL